MMKKDPTIRMLNRIHDLPTFDCWCCDHFHQDMEAGRVGLVMNDAIQIQSAYASAAQPVVFTTSFARGHRAAVA